ncbi:MAG: hypothetical protein U5R48_19050 [Gammaproteobacteria bacterium]|nr:hypothetical protein [Gammaproteobacteria bacterium]
MSTFALSSALAVETRTTLRELGSTTAALGIVPCLIGAQARVIWLEHINGLRALRATTDTDFVIQIDTWDTFAELGDRLVQDHGWRRDPRRVQRSTVPATRWSTSYRAVEWRKATLIHWPPDHSHRMDVRGFEIALREAIELDVSPELAIRIAPLSVLVLLKLLSWSDRVDGREKDAQDLVSILKVYGDTIEARDLLVEEPNLELYELEDTDEARGARLVGRQVRQMVDESTLRLVHTILANELDPDGQQHLVLYGSKAFGYAEDRDEQALGMLEAFKRGFEDIR